MMTDTSRRWWVTASAAFMVVGTLYGFGVLGERVEESSGGAFAADATLLTPATPAFSIWSLIYLGLMAYVVWQWLPGNRSSARARRIGWLSALSMALNGAWLLVTQVGALWMSVGVIAILVLTLGELMRRLGQSPPASASERVILDGVFGLYLGWVTVATIANVTASLVASGVNPGARAAQAWAVGVLALGAALGVLLAFRLGGRLTVAAGMAWALVWIAVGRLQGAPPSGVTAAAAIVAALVVLAVALGVRWRNRRITATAASL